MQALGYTITSHNCVFNRGLCRICYTQPVNWPVNPLVTSYHIRLPTISERKVVAR